MLILSRKEDESVIIGDNIVVKVLSAEKGVVKLGFEAPNNMLILREELKKAVEDENKKATHKVDDSLLGIISKKLKK